MLLLSDKINPLFRRLNIDTKLSDIEKCGNNAYILNFEYLSPAVEGVNNKFRKNPKFLNS